MGLKTVSFSRLSGFNVQCASCDGVTDLLWLS